jgi:hypothetical protein
MFYRNSEPIFEDKNKIKRKNDHDHDEQFNELIFLCEFLDELFHDDLYLACS